MFREADACPPHIALATDASGISGEDTLYGAAYLRTISKGFWPPIQVTTALQTKGKRKNKMLMTTTCCATRLFKKSFLARTALHVKILYVQVLHQKKMQETDRCARKKTTTTNLLHSFRFCCSLSLASLCWPSLLVCLFLCLSVSLFLFVCSSAHMSDCLLTRS